MSSTSIHTTSDDNRYRHHIQPLTSSTSHNDPPTQSSRQMTQSIGYVEGFDVSVNVKRAFTFEELQSGAYLSSLDESDLQFYGMYGHPILIPCSDDFTQPGWSLQGQTHMGGHSSIPYSTTAIHQAPHSNPRAFQITKSYTLVGSLGDLSASTSTQTPSGVAHGARVSPAARHSSEIGLNRDSSLIQQPLGNHLYPSDFASSSVLHHTRQRYTHEGITLAGPGNSVRHGGGDVKLFDDEPPMDHLPYPPPVLSAPSHEFQPHDSPDAITHSPSPYSPRSPVFLGTSYCDASEVPMTVPSQSYMFVEVEPSTPAFIHTNQQHYHLQNDSPSHTHSESTGSPHQRSPSPRGASRISPPPHPKRSMDKKPALACLFCRGRKIACGPPVPGSKDRTCNQCARRHLKCEYPLESRRGMRKRRSLVPRASGSPPSEINPAGPKVIKSGRKRSVDKRS